MVFILSALWWRRIRGLWKLPDGRGWLRGKLGLVLMGRAMFSKSLIQFSVDGRDCVPSLFFDLRPNYGGGDEDNGNFVQFRLVAQSCPTLCAPMNLGMPGLPVHHQLPEFTQTHVHWVGDAIQPSHPLSSPSPPAFNLSQHQGLFKWVSSLHQMAKVLEFHLQH